MDQNRILFLAIGFTMMEGSLLAIVFRMIPDYWRRNRILGVVYVAVCLVVLNYGLLSAYLAGWFLAEEHAAAVQVIAAATQAILAVVLVGLTYGTVQSNAEMARANEKMAEIAVQQQQAAIRPVLVFCIHPPENQQAPDVHHFVIEVFNAGAGPALDARVIYSGPFKFAEPTDYVQPLAIARDEGPAFSFKLEKESPMLDPNDSLRWPRTEEDAALEEEVNALEAAKVWKN
jgi:hypothetical protein